MYTVIQKAVHPHAFHMESEEKNQYTLCILNSHPNLIQPLVITPESLPLLLLGNINTLAFPVHSTNALQILFLHLPHIPLSLLVLPTPSPNNLLQQVPYHRPDDDVHMASGQGD